MEQTSINETGNVTASSTLIAPNDSVVLKATFQIYGSLYFTMFIVFCWLRVKFKRVYNVRAWIPELKGKLSENHLGHIDWCWKVWFIGDDDFRHQCGLDALCFTRILQFGLRLSIMGIVNSVWLMPLYGTAENSPETAHITDKIAKLTTGNVPPGSPRFIGTVIAAYITFVYTMYLLLQEFEWFTKTRHLFLGETEPRNYTLYVNNIPSEYRSSAKLLRYFRTCFSHDSVLEAHVALNIPSLERKVEQREGLLLRLEHAINVMEVRGKTPYVREGKTRIAKVNAIDKYLEEVTFINKDIRDCILNIEDNALHNSSHTDDRVDAQKESFHFDLEALESKTMTEHGGQRKPFSGAANGDSQGESIESTASRNALDQAAPWQKNQLVTEDSGQTNTANAPLNSMRKRNINVSKSKKEDNGNHQEEGVPLKARRKFSPGSVGSVATKSLEGISMVAGGFAHLAFKTEGAPRSAGFVTFTRLSTTQAALQMSHHPKPFVMNVAEAPDPHDIFWENVGKRNKSLQVGKLVSFLLSLLVCIFWTIPISFVVTLTEVDSLKSLLPFLEPILDKAPWIGAALAQLGPLILILVNNLLPDIMGYFSQNEGPVSSSVLEVSKFVKLAAFGIIQTFFVSAVSGSLVKELSNILDNPEKLVDLLANALPSQSTYFIQILLISTVLGQGLELLKVWQIGIASLRKVFGPKLTENERNRKWGFLRPLNDPKEFEYADVTSNTIFAFVVFFVYSTMAPLTNWFMAICFTLSHMGYRHQLIYNYPTSPDSGGRLWLGFVNIFLTCILIGEFTLTGLLALKKATIAVPMMFPLLVGTILFNMYIKQQHFTVPNRLSSRDCLKKDLKNQAGEGMSFDFVRGAYVQPALQSKAYVFPPNLADKHKTGIPDDNDNDNVESDIEADWRDVPNYDTDRMGEEMQLHMYVDSIERSNGTEMYEVQHSAEESTIKHEDSARKKKTKKKRKNDVDEELQLHENVDSLEPYGRDMYEVKQSAKYVVKLKDSEPKQKTKKTKKASRKKGISSHPELVTKMIVWK